MKLIATAALAAASIALVGCGESTPKPFVDISLRVYCADQIKSLLRDPDSYQYISATVSSTNGEYGSGTVRFRSKNGFGGYADGSASCTVYDKNGETWVRASIN